MNERIRENIVFIGLPGSGKSSYGKRIAKDLRLGYADTDELIAKSAGMPLPELFATYGEPAFRDLETKTLKKLAGGAAHVSSDLIDSPHIPAGISRRVNEGGCIISVGGGIVLRDENIALLKRIGVVVFIDRAASAIAGNSDITDGRPLVRNRDDVLRLDAERRARYENAADIVFHNDDDYRIELERLKSVVILLGVCGGMCLIGDPVAHSLSPRMHRVIFAKHGIGGRYRAALVSPDRLTDAAGHLRAGKLQGLNATKPHKMALIPLLDELRGDAALARAVNTVKKEGNRLIGYNTDMEGFALALARAGRGYRDASVMIFGAGGAAAGIAAKAFACGAAAVTVVCRGAADNSKSAFPQGTCFIVRDIASGVVSPRDTEFIRALESVDILVNSTPLGMTGWREDFRGFGFLDRLSSKTLVCDLIYEPDVTRLLHEASSRKLDTLNGLPMLIYQGILADEIVFNILTERESLYEAVYDYIISGKERKEEEF
jgi:shikimate dehydrogenase